MKSLVVTATARFKVLNSDSEVLNGGSEVLNNDSEVRLVGGVDMEDAPGAPGTTIFQAWVTKFQARVIKFSVGGQAVRV